MTNSDSNLNNAIKGLPHAEPFRFLDEVLELSSNKARGLWKISGEEDFFRGHFPNRPLVPGVLLVEAAAQLAGVLASHRTGAKNSAGMLVLSESKFKRSIEPPADIELIVAGDRVMGSIHLLDFTATHNGIICAEGQVGLRIGDST